MKNECLFIKIEEFYTKLLYGKYEHPFALASALEELSCAAWDEVDLLYQASVRID